MKLDIIEGYLEVYDDDSYEYCNNSRYDVIEKLVTFKDDYDTYAMCHDFYSYDETGKLAILKALIEKWPIKLVKL